MAFSFNIQLLTKILAWIRYFYPLAILSYQMRYGRNWESLFVLGILLIVLYVFVLLFAALRKNIILPSQSVSLGRLPISIAIMYLSYKSNILTLSMSVCGWGYWSLYLFSFMFDYFLSIMCKGKTIR